MTLTAQEERALKTFREYLMTPNRMLCFSGPSLEQHGKALEELSDKELLSREKRPGAYSLTQAGYSAMQNCA